MPKKGKNFKWKPLDLGGSPIGSIEQDSAVIVTRNRRVIRVPAGASKLAQEFRDKFASSMPESAKQSSDNTEGAASQTQPENNKEREDDMLFALLELAPTAAALLSKAATAITKRVSATADSFMGKHTSTENQDAPVNATVEDLDKTVVAVSGEDGLDLDKTVTPDGSSGYASSPSEGRVSGASLAETGSDSESESSKVVTQAEAARVEAERAEAARAEAERAEAERVEAARVEAARVEAARVEAARVEAARVEAARVEAARVEAARVEAARVEAARVEAARVEAERVEAARVEAARVEAARVEAARVEAERAEAERAEAERAEAARVEAARVEAEKAAAEKAAAVKPVGLRLVPELVRGNGARSPSAAAAAFSVSSMDASFASHNAGVSADPANSPHVTIHKSQNQTHVISSAPSIDESKKAPVASKKTGFWAKVGAWFSGLWSRVTAAIKSLFSATKPVEAAHSVVINKADQGSAFKLSDPMQPFLTPRGTSNRGTVAKEPVIEQQKKKSSCAIM